MEKKLFINPPSLLRWQPKGKRSEVLFLDLEPDFLDEKTMRIDLNLVFRPIAVRRGWLQKKDYYVGSTGARVVFDTDDGRVKKYTRGMALKIDYENTYTHLRQTAVKLAPELGAGTSGEFALGEVRFDKNTQRSFTTRFSGSERTLSDIDLGKGVEWEIALPDGQAVRDYLIGNVFLYVECSWDQGAKQGTIEFCPSDVLFFDAKRRVIADEMKALLMRFVLYRQEQGLSRNPVTINFKETR